MKPYTRLHATIKYYITTIKLTDCTTISEEQ